MIRWRKEDRASADDAGKGGRTVRRYVWLLLAALLLAGCSAQEPREAMPPASAPAGAAAPAVSLPAEQQEEGLSATQLEAEPRPLTEEEVLAAYYRAVEAYGWFDLSPLPDNGETVRADGTVYRRVDFPGMEEVEDLRTYLRSLFSGELTEWLLDLGGDKPFYRDIDGALYVSAVGRARAVNKGASQVEVHQTDGHSYSVEVTVDLLGDDRAAVIGLECWSFPFTFVDGRWVFTDFCLVS